MTFSDEQWLCLLQAAEALDMLGVSQNAFCAEVSVVPSTFCRHKKRLRGLRGRRLLSHELYARMPACLRPVLARYRSALQMGFAAEAERNRRQAKKGALV